LSTRGKKRFPVPGMEKKGPHVLGGALGFDTPHEDRPRKGEAMR